MNKRYRDVVPDGAVRSDLVVVSTPTLELLPSIAKAQEPVRVQAFGPEAPIEALNERVVRWLSGAREVERHIVSIGPEI